MCNLIGGAVTLVVGLVLVAVSCFVAFGVVPGIVDSTIESEVTLVEHTEQFERFEEVPFPLTFNVYLFNVTNVAEVLAGGVPVVTEIGPYAYKLYQSREIENISDDSIWYRRRDLFEFDDEASFPLTEDDHVTIVNIAFHSILQMAEQLFPELMWGLNIGLSGIFGEHTGPIMTVRVRDLLFGGVALCKTPGIIGAIACGQIRTLSANVRNIEQMNDGSLNFTVLKYKDDTLSDTYVVHRGLEDSRQMGIISSFNNSAYLTNWVNREVDGEVQPSVCNMVNGTDSGIFPPFVDREQPAYALNTDICRHPESILSQAIFYFHILGLVNASLLTSGENAANLIYILVGILYNLIETIIFYFHYLLEMNQVEITWTPDVSRKNNRSAELRYQYDTEYRGIPVARFSANEWFLDNDEGCFCLNVTTGINRENGCLKRGAMELYSCVGAFLVLSYPHFLYADFRYRNGIIGMHPFEEQHRIFVDLEPNTGTVIRGMKRAQFNVFMRPVTNVPSTQQLRTTLMPIFWVEEGMQLPEEYVNMLTTRLLQRLRLVDIFIPVIIAACALVVLLGVAILIRVRYVRKNSIGPKPHDIPTLSDAIDK